MKRLFLAIAFALILGLIGGALLAQGPMKGRFNWLSILGDDGYERGQFAVQNGMPMLTFYAPDRKSRLQLAVYDGSQGAQEKGQPLVALSDNRGELRLLLRLAGKNESPVLVFKDRKHRDRMVLGLALHDGDEEPFLAIFDKDGKPRNIFGAYAGK